MRRTRITYAALALYVCVCFSACVNRKPRIAPEGPRVVAGALDLRGAAPDQEISLDGEWRFAWLAMPTDGRAPPTDVLFTIPGFWNGQSAGGRSLSAEGYATYALTIRTDRPGLYALRIIDMESAYALYANGRRIASNGVVGKSAQEERPEWRPLVALVELEPETELTLVVSNFHHRLGGVWQGLALGSPDQLLKNQRDATALQLLLAGSLLMIAIYHCVVFFARRQGRAFLYLGLFCLCMSLRTLVTGERYLVSLWPGLTWDLLVRLDYLTVSVGVIFSHLQLSAVFHRYYHRPALYLLLLIFGACAIAEITLAPRIFSHLLPVHGAVVTLWSLYFLGVSFVAVLQKMPGAAVVWAGWMIAIAGGIHDAMLLHSSDRFQYLFALGLQAFVLTQSYYLATQYAEAFSRSDTLTERMQNLLTLTRELGRSGERSVAIERALQAICVAVRAAPESSIAYLPDRDGRFVQKFVPGRALEALPRELSARILRSPSYEYVDDALRFSLRAGSRLLCALEFRPAARPAAATPAYPEAEYVDGILDSLRLVLENIERVEREELARIGQAAAEIVHDINHHCHIISAGVRAARDSPADRAAAIDSIDREVAFMIHLAQDVLDYARAELVVFPEPIAAETLAATIREDLAGVFRDTGVQYSVERRGEGRIRVDVERFRRVVLNLARNALAALGEGRSANGEPGRFQVAMEKDAHGWRFSFADNGPGLSPEQAARFFEPFASGGRGAGLGLAVVERIVVAHGGAVRVTAGAGGGARFEADLPDS